MAYAIEQVVNNRNKKEKEVMMNPTIQNAQKPEQNKSKTFDPQANKNLGLSKGQIKKDDVEINIEHESGSDVDSHPDIRSVKTGRDNMNANKSSGM